VREIKFRGKRVDNGELVYGHYVSTKDSHYICYDGQYNDDLFLSPENIMIEVIPESVGQFTGLHDKNGKDIYEGDIVTAMFKTGYSDGYVRKPFIEVVKYLDHRAGFYPMSDCEMWREHDDGKISSIEVIDNIYENSELLEVRP